MKFHSTLYVATPFLFLSAISGNALELNEACYQAYKQNLADLNVHNRVELQIAALADRHCERNGTVSSGSETLGIDTVLDDFSFGLFSDEESKNLTLGEFCKSAATFDFGNLIETSSTYAVVVQAQENFNSCLRVGESDVVLTHEFQHPERVIFRGDFTTTEILFNIQGLDYDEGKAICLSSAFSEGGEEEVVGGERRVVQRPFTITCERTDMTPEGTNFPPLRVALKTNLETYTVTLPGDTLNDFETARAASRQFDALTSEMSNLSDELRVARETISRQLAAIDNLKSTPNAYSILTHHGSSVFWWDTMRVAAPRHTLQINCPRTSEVVNAAIGNTCDAGYRPLLHQPWATTSGGPCGHTWHELICLKVQ